MSDSEPLATMLRRLRKSVGLSQVAAGELAARNQPWISRFERGARVPTRGEAEILARVYRVGRADRRRLLSQSRDLREDRSPPARMVIRRGADGMQHRVGRIERSSARIAHFHPAAVAGLLQTAAYARAVFASGGDIPAAQRADALEARMARQSLVDAAGREFVFVLTEGVLRWPLGGPAVMAAQLDRIAERSRLPHVRVGVFPWSSPVTVAPMNGFDLYDQRAAVVGSEVGTAFLSNPHDVGRYVKLFADLEHEATWGDGARRVIEGVAAEYRRLV